MDDRHFDALTRALGTSGTRRALSAQLGSAVGWLTISPDVPGVAVARKNKKQNNNKNKKRRPKGKVRVEGPCGNGSGKANRCKRNSQCCTKHCDKKKGRCRCLKLGQACDSDRLCCPGRTGRSCQGGTCQPALPCDGDVCASGCPESSLQAAIDAASDGAALRLCAGVYDPIVIAKDITLIGVGDGADPASNTILDAANSGRVVTIGSGHTVVFDGLRITGGLAAGGSENDNGGGVLNGTNSSLTMTGCTVTGNTATDSGGGVLNVGTVTLNGCSIDQNIAGTDGGGILSGNGGALTLNGSSVTGNTAPLGGGVYVSSGTATLDASSVAGNTATQSNGGGIHSDVCCGATVTLQNGSTVEDNEPDNCVGTINGPGCAP